MRDGQRLWTNLLLKCENLHLEPGLDLSVLNLEAFEAVNTGLDLLGQPEEAARAGEAEY